METTTNKVYLLLTTATEKVDVGRFRVQQLDVISGMERLVRCVQHACAVSTTSAEVVERLRVARESAVVGVELLTPVSKSANGLRKGRARSHDSEAVSPAKRLRVENRGLLGTVTDVEVSCVPTVGLRVDC